MSQNPNVVLARAPSNKLLPLQLTDEGKLKVDATVTINVGTLATNTAVEATTTAIGLIESALAKYDTTSGGATSTMRVAMSFTRKTGTIASNITIAYGEATSVADIEGCTHVTIFYADSFTPGDSTRKTLGLFVELSPNDAAENVTTSVWYPTDIIVSPQAAATNGFLNTTYPSGTGTAYTRFAFAPRIPVAGFKSLRLRNEVSNPLLTGTTYIDDNFTQCKATFVGTSV